MTSDIVINYVFAYPSLVYVWLIIEITNDMHK